jgi:hypothetical protein
MVQINWISDYFNSIQKNIQTRSVWNIWSWILVCILLLLLISYIYSIFLKQDLDRQIWEKLEQSQEIASAISVIQSNNEHRKYQIAQYLHEEKRSIQWYPIVQSLINTFEKLQTQYNYQWLTIQDFQINTDKIIVKGSAQNLDIMYQNPSVLDTFQELEYIKSIDIPYYKKFTDNFEFLLEATLQ